MFPLFQWSKQNQQDGKNHDDCFAILYFSLIFFLRNVNFSLPNHLTHNADFLG